MGEGEGRVFDTAECVEKRKKRLGFGFVEKKKRSSKSRFIFGCSVLRRLKF